MHTFPKFEGKKTLEKKHYIMYAPVETHLKLKRYQSKNNMFHLKLYFL